MADYKKKMVEAELLTPGSLTILLQKILDHNPSPRTVEQVYKELEPGELAIRLEEIAAFLDYWRDAGLLIELEDGYQLSAQGIEKCKELRLRPFNVH
jgi:hypothetical protein